MSLENVETLTEFEWVLRIHKGNPISSGLRSYCCCSLIWKGKKIERAVRDWILSSDRDFAEITEKGLVNGVRCQEFHGLLIMMIACSTRFIIKLWLLSSWVSQCFVNCVSLCCISELWLLQLSKCVAIVVWN